MVDETVPPTLGLLGTLAIAAVAAAPYVALPAAEASGLGPYYSAGFVGPWVVTMLALVAAIAFAAGRQDRTPPETAAGATLGLGLVMTALAALWAFSVDETLVLQIGSADWIEYHRWLFLAATLVVPAAASLYARVLRLF